MLYILYILYYYYSGKKINSLEFCDTATANNMTLKKNVHKIATTIVLYFRYYVVFTDCTTLGVYLRCTTLAGTYTKHILWREGEATL